MTIVQLLLAAAACAAIGVTLWRAAQWVAADARARQVVDQARDAVAAVEHGILARDGGTPEQPIDVQSAAAIEPRAESQECPWCDGRPHVVEHTVLAEGDDRIREVTTRCGDCGRRTTLYFRVHPPLLN
jgi:hypothetical protein